MESIYIDTHGFPFQTAERCVKMKASFTIIFFTITAEILARSLLNFHSEQIVHEFLIDVMRQRARTDNLTICYRKKQIEDSFSCVCPVIDNEFLHNFVKIVCGSTSTANLTSVTTKFMTITRQIHPP